MGLSAHQLAQMGVQPWRLNDHFAKTEAPVAPVAHVADETPQPQAQLLWIEPGLVAQGQTAQNLITAMFQSLQWALDHTGAGLALAWQTVDPAVWQDEADALAALDTWIEWGPDLALCTDMNHAFVEMLSEGVMVESVPSVAEMLTSGEAKAQLYQQLLTLMRQAAHGDAAG